ncbi:hypothetical protein [Corynebacterium sp. NML180780]
MERLSRDPDTYLDKLKHHVTGTR